LSDAVPIRFRGVTKEYRVGTVASAGLKNFFLHLPRFLREAREHKPFRALDDLSFEVAAGECLGIIGPNGSGKSTTLGLIAGVLRATAGEIETSGRICPLLELGAGFHSELTGTENVYLNGVLLGMRRSEVRERYEEIAAFSELGEFMARPIRTYSSGMLARLGFSVAIHVEPRILLVDEVLAVGDAAFQTKCRAKIAEFQGRGATIVYVSHDLVGVRAICDRALYLEHGRAVALGPAADVIARYVGGPTAASPSGT
jgi:lipopolysaccharide transport system ATP-binding protein